MPLKSRAVVAWSLALTPVVLVIPVLMLAGMGMCGFSEPLVPAVAFLMFIVLEIASIRCFVQAARSSRKAIGAIFGIGLATILLVAYSTLEFCVTADYWAEALFR
jgi:hypothetical protein